MLHYLDDLDSKMEAMRTHFDREAELDGPWTSYNASLGRPLLNSRKFFQGEKTPTASNVAQEDKAAAATASEPEAKTDMGPASPVPALDLFSEQKA